MQNPIDTIEEVSNFIFTSKYAKFLPKENRRETWPETVSRVEQMHLRHYKSFLSAEDVKDVKWAFDMVREKRVVPSMRSMQFGGEAIEKKNQRLYNCSVRHVDSLRAFAEIFHLLLCGCGVGFGLSKFFLDRLPDLVNAQDKTGLVTTYVIEDTIEGWADSLEALLCCYFKNTPYTGRKIVFDYSRIRRKGETLKTSGGKAPGYKPLKEAHKKIKKLLDYVIEEQGMMRLRSIDAYDILLHAADAVLSGGIRRSSCAAIFEKDDKLMLGSKVDQTVDRSWTFDKIEKDGKTEYHGRITYKGEKIDVILLSEYELKLLKEKNLISWFHVEPQRKRANNSVLLLRDQVTIDEFRAIVERTKQYGEPGFVFANHPWTLFNPCVTEDTLVLTKHGNLSIKSISNRDVEIWNGFEWSVVYPHITGIDQEIWRVTLDTGQSLDCTAYHRWLVDSDYDDPNLFTEIETKNLKIGDILFVGNMPNPEERMYVRQPTIVNIEKLPDKKTVYCFNEPKRHAAVFNGIMTGQCFEISFIPVTDDGRCGVSFCNLTSINGRLVKTKDDFVKASIASAIIGTLQAGYTNFRYLGKVSEELTREEALLGCSITGFMDSPKILLNPEIQVEAAQAINETNIKWAKKLNINPAARRTACKPEGTASLLLGTASGIHPHHDSKRYFRRVVCNKMEPPYRFFKKINPKLCEEYVHNPNKTDDVITFPIIPPSGAIGKTDITAIEHLNIILSTKKNWINTGSIGSKKPLTHNISCTISVKEDEWVSVINFIFENRNEFAAVSLFPSFGDKKFAQAPNERVLPEDEERWNNIINNLSHVDYREMRESDDQTNFIGEVACGDGQCDAVMV